MKNHRILAFDFGLKRIGIAAGNTQTKTSQPIKIINNNKDWTHFDKIINEWRPGKLVVGLPISMDGNETVISRHAREFGKQISKRYGLDVEFCDERLSSKEAKYRIEANKFPEGKPKSTNGIDHLSAQLILETYFQNEFE